MWQSINDHHNIVSLDLFSVLKDKEEWFFGRFVQQLHYLRKRQWLGGGYNSKGNSTGAQNFNFEKFLLISVTRRSRSDGSESLSHWTLADLTDVTLASDELIPTEDFTDVALGSEEKVIQ